MAQSAMTLKDPKPTSLTLNISEMVRDTDIVSMEY